MMNLLNRLVAHVMERRPDYIIGETSNPYMLRWWVIPRNKWFNIYLNCILRSDDDRALHDHPWWNASFLLDGGYVEVVPFYQDQPASADNRGRVHHFRRSAGDFITRSATDRHRLVVEQDEPCVSLFFTGPAYRTWGFYCERGFVRHQDYLKPTTKYGQSLVGRGCD